MPAVPLVLAGMLAVLAAFVQEEVAGDCPAPWVEQWESVERAGWILISALALLDGAAWG